MASLSYPKYDTLPQIFASQGEPNIYSPKGNYGVNFGGNKATMSVPFMNSSGYKYDRWSPNKTMLENAGHEF